MVGWVSTAATGVGGALTGDMLTCSWEFPRLNGEGSKVAGRIGMG